MILAGDVGGTKTHVGLFEPGAERPRRVRLETYSSREHAGLEELVERFLAADDVAPDAACFGVAGPVRRGRAKITNLPWVVDARRLGERFDVDTVLLNDLEATAWATEVLRPDELAVLQSGTVDPDGNVALIAAGTGLGEALMLRRDGALVPSATEGGHADFAPVGPLQRELLGALEAELGRVEFEHVLSGPGLERIHRFVHGRHLDLAESCSAGEADDTAATVSDAGLAGRCPCCRRSLETFVDVYGAEAGNLALAALATGGVYLGGGIAPKILDALRWDRFLAAFATRVSFSELMAQIPVRVIVNPEAALLGAAVRAARELG